MRDVYTKLARHFSAKAEENNDDSPLLGRVDKFCHLGDILDADGGCNSAVIATVWAAQKVSY